ncbi:hypothetical protein [uncultured Psychroserpens sp.]|uniref:hypothetical protein n=1 Tax=uncultured Psychroserpens sp. TaxID=255436 RepID=UPI0026290F71|nr:hypothetical protein [uncultured Psychroserpens sp.]
METLEYDNLYFHCNDSDEYNIHIKITESENPFSDTIWECTLKGLWEDEYELETPELRRIWDMHNEGDYFQQTLIRHNRNLRPKESFTALFHRLLREQPNELLVISNLYSTSKLNWLSMEFTISPPAENFWTIQTRNNLAEFIESEQRFRAML